LNLRCPHCLALIPEKAARCAVCGGATDAAPVAPASDAIRLAPELTPPASAPRGQPGMGYWLLRAVGAVALVVMILGTLLALALLLAAVGWGAIAWPAFIGIAGVFALSGLLQVERQRRRLAGLLAPAADATTLAELSDLELVHLFAGRFAAPGRGHDAFWPPLSPVPVRAEEAAWRAIAATLLDLAEREVVELEPRTLPAAHGSIAVMGIRLVRPLPQGDALASHLLHPLVRRGVGASAIVSDLASQHLMPHRWPARALLESAHEHLTALGFYRPPGIHPRGKPRRLWTLPGDWLSAAILRPVRPDPVRIASARPALAALEQRLIAWDTRDAAQVALLYGEIRAGLLRARARARHTAG
jgi:hypothetical protein